MENRIDREALNKARTNAQDHAFMTYLTRLAPSRKFLLINVILVAIGVATITLLYVQITK